MAAQAVVDEKNGDESKAPEVDLSSLKLVEVKEIPAKMQALQLIAYDDDMSKALSLNEIDVPACDKDKILIKVCSASLNPVDWKIAKGYLKGMAEVNFPRAIGRDYAGYIVKLGENVAGQADNKLKVGMRVAGMLDLFGEPGSFSEYICTKRENIAIISNDLSYDIAAAIPLVTMTAYQVLMNETKLSSNKGLKVIILGGSSSVGLAGIQICKLYGAAEICVTSSQVDLCTKYGATKVFNYKDKDAKKWFEELKDKNFDVIFDCVGGQDSWDNAQSVLDGNNGGVFISVVGGIKPNAEKDNPKHKYKFYFVQGTKEMQDLYNLVNVGKIVPILDEDSPYKVEKWADMVGKSLAHKAHGKLILRFSDN